MDRLQKLGVFLNDEPGDDEALAFAGLLTRLAKPQIVHCIHVRGVEDHPATPVPNSEDLRRRVLEAIGPGVSDSVQVDVSEATGLPEMLRVTRDRDLDLVVVGRRLPHDQLGVGAVFYRLARKSPCDVLVVPAGAHAHLTRLLVLVDGSPHSRMALETALHLSRSADGRPQVVAQSVYSVGYGYRYTGKSFEEAARQREALVRKQIEAFLAGLDTSGVDFSVVYTCSEDTAAVAHDLASAKNMDAIVVGSRGATLPAIALLGGTTERVLVNSPVPVLVVKRKGETFRFLDAVLAQFRE